MKKEERKNAFPGSILEDPEKRLFLYREASDNEKFAISNVWNNVKFFTTISSALLTASIAVFKVIRNPPALGGCEMLTGRLSGIHRFPVNIPTAQRMTSGF